MSYFDLNRSHFLDIENVFSKHHAHFQRTAKQQSLRQGEAKGMRKHLVWSLD
jgi:hypothetical protein